MQLLGRTAVISGAAHGIGKATAERFAAEGASVVVADIDDRRALDVVAGIRDAGGTAEYLRTDISNPEDVASLVQFACERFGSLDILHNNAYVLGPGRVDVVELVDWNRTIDVCLTGYWACTKAALEPMLRQGKGVILNTGSIASLAADFGMAAYSTAKAGVLNLTRVTALDYARKGIRCNAILPGPVWTRPEAHLVRLLSESPLPPDSIWPLPVHAMQDSVPLRRLGRPSEVANLALFLASDASSFMTGAACVIDGGMYAQIGTRALAGTAMS